MAKRELIDRNNLESTTIITDDFSDNKILDVVLMEDIKETPVITEQEIVKPYLDKIRAEIMRLDDINPDYPMDRTIHISRNEVLQIIDKYKAESEGEE